MPHPYGESLPKPRASTLIYYTEQDINFSKAGPVAVSQSPRKRTIVKVAVLAYKMRRLERNM